MSNRKIYNYLYLAFDGAAYKIGVTNFIEKRKPVPPNRGMPVKIIRCWERPGDALTIEKSIKVWFSDRVAHGQEWFDVEEHEIMARIKRELWYIDEHPKNRLARYVP